MKLTDYEIIEKYGRPPIVETLTTSSVDDYFRRSVRSGVPWEMAMIYTVVSNSKGQKFFLARGWQMSSSFVSMTGEFNSDLTKPSPRVFKNVYRGPIKFDLDEDQHKIKIRSYPSRHNFKVDIEVGKFHWEEENGALNLDFKSLGPALQCSDMGEGDYENTHLSSQMLEVKGTLNGEEVSGFGAIDQDWLPSGIGWMQCKFHTHIEEMWLGWATRYDNGSIEYGVNFSGAGDWCRGFYVKDGTAIISKDSSIDINWGDAGDATIPLEVNFQTGDHNFKFVAESRMNVIKGGMNIMFGRVINPNKADRPVESMALCEFRAPGV